MSLSSRAFTIGLMIVACASVWQTLGLGSVARRTPLVVGVLLIPLLVVQLVREHVGRRSTRTSKSPGPVEPVVVATFWVALLPAAIQLTGLWAGTALFSFALTRWWGRESLPTALAAAGAMTLVVWVVIDVLLSMSPPVPAFLRLFGT